MELKSELASAQQRANDAESKLELLGDTSASEGFAAKAKEAEAEVVASRQEVCGRHRQLNGARQVHDNVPPPTALQLELLKSSTRRCVEAMSQLMSVEPSTQQVRGGQPSRGLCFADRVGACCRMPAAASTTWWPPCADVSRRLSTTASRSRTSSTQPATNSSR